MDASQSQPVKWDLLEKTPQFLIILWVSKWISDKFIFGPIARRNGLATNPPPLPPNPSLEKLYEQYGAGKRDEILSIGQKKGMSPDEVKEWLVLRRKQDEESEADKFAYECFTAAFYIFLNSISLYLLPKQSWFWDSHESMNDRSEPRYEVAVFFTISFSFFVFDFMILAMKRYERKDFLVIRIHHLVTILLMLWCFYTNMTSSGCMIIFTMELVSPFPYISRIGWKLKIPAASDITFIVFGITWFFGRVIFLHHYLIRSYVIMRYNTENPSIHDFIKDFLLFVILIVNAYWTYQIINKFIKKLDLQNPMNILKGLSKALASRD